MTNEPQNTDTPTGAAPAPKLGDPGYDHSKASWYPKLARDMTDDEVNEAHAYYQSIGELWMESEWLKRRGLPPDYGKPALTNPALTDADASTAELLAAARDDYATAQAQREPQLPPLSPELAALAAEADQLTEGEDQ
ncbi:hypothetical protein [Streptomyces graminilatus]|uniref:hypothetical protein n=1 Tax=Streptomyces graminilatus TaxID=1464070 RepID=UPI0006E21661|nr:hypothetical protein [Streptomyces graminilatus]